MVTSFCSLVGFWRCVGETLFVFLRSRGTLMRVRFGMVGFLSWIDEETMQLMSRLILVVGDLIFR